MNLIFDIETGPLPRNEVLAACESYPPYTAPPPFDAGNVKLGNVKDEKKIEQKIREAHEKHQAESAGAVKKWEAGRVDYEAACVERAALSPLTGRVLAVGYYCDALNPPVELHGDDDEAAMLRQFWQRFSSVVGKGGFVVGFNVKGFDLPFLIRRAWRLGVNVPAGLLERRRFWHEGIIDVYEAWLLGARPGDKAHSAKLTDIARYFGVGEKTNGYTGADFARLWSEERAAAEAYLKNDLELTYHVALRMGLV